MCNCPHNKKKNLIHLKVSADSATWSLEENNKLLTINYLLLNLNITATKYIIGDISGGLDKRPELHFFERYSNLVFKKISSGTWRIYRSPSLRFKVEDIRSSENNPPFKQTSFSGGQVSETEGCPRAL